MVRPPPVSTRAYTLCPYTTLFRSPHLRLNATVIAITRAGLGRMASAGRDTAPFALRWRDAGGDEHITLARAVIDASGTWGQPAPLGVDGLPVPGETAEIGRAHV